MSVLIAGCGDLGTEIGLRFADAGYQVAGIRRSPEVLPDPITGLRCDLATQRPPVPTETKIVVMATSPDARTEDAYRAAYLRSLEHLLDGLDAADTTVERMILVSSTAVHDTNDGGWITEDSATEASTATAAVLAETERLLHARLPQATILRLAGLYGPGRTRLIDRVRTGTAQLPSTKRYTNRIHRDDAAAAIVHLATAVSDPASVYLGADDEPCPRADVMRFLADEIGATLLPAADSGDLNAPSGKRVSNRRLTGTGFALRYPTYRHGYRAILSTDGVRHP
ncbi:epimerase [Arthrobacter castelli]|uniref:epimerase n=1 Tax=Arthrobacter castelli TaxID=271431 RepID=UPI000403DC5A|nr:epimerase [Arthrobacter castelli]